jgi:transcription antitermination factor NusG
VELPLFPGYVFVHTALCDRVKVLQSPGITRFVAFSGIPAEIPEFEIERLRHGFVGLSPEPHPYLCVGDMVSVKSGPLAGLQGIVVNKKNETRIVISMNLLRRSISVEVDPVNLEPVMRPPETVACASAPCRRMPSAYESSL